MQQLATSTLLVLCILPIWSVCAHPIVDSLTLTPSQIDSARQTQLSISSVHLTDSVHNLTPRADSPSVAPTKRTQLRKIIPRQATLRSLMLPGLGQIYNRQYWKLPIIYGGLGVAILVFNWNHSLLNQYVAGYRAAFNSSVIDPLYGTKTAVVRGEVRTITYLKQASDQFQRQLTLTIILTTAGWALNAIEANVAAHLKTFDVSDDISMRVSPTLQPMPGLGIAPGIRVAFRYK